MDPSHDLAIRRLRRLKADPSDIWQGGLYRVPGWITGEGETPYRAWFALWAGQSREVFEVGRPLEPGQAGPSRVLEALANLAADTKRAGYRPRRVEVSDPALADYLRAALSEVGVEVDLKERVGRLDALVGAMTEKLCGPASASSAFEGAGVTIPRMRSFAGAAAAFYKARLWEQLVDEDLVRVETPVPHPKLAHAVVMGAAGMTRGLAFYESTEDFEEMVFGEHPREYLRNNEAWSVNFDPITDIPLPDADLWEDHDLAVAAPDAYPYVMIASDRGGLQRPDAPVLAGIEAILRALASTSEDELDRGRWTKTVSTPDGKVDVTMALPGVLALEDEREVGVVSGGPGGQGPGGISSFPDRRLLERGLRRIGELLADKEFASTEEMNEFVNAELNRGAPAAPPPTTDREKALDLFYRALESTGRAQVKLCRDALGIDPDCADAYVLLAECTPDPERAQEFYRRGVKAAERTPGGVPVEKEGESNWPAIETRTYLRALYGVARCLYAIGRGDEALQHFQAVLRFDPDDHQGARFTIARMLLDRGEHDQAGELLDRFAEDESAGLAYPRALLRFRLEGDSAAARSARAAAINENRHLARLLLGKASPPHETPQVYSFGSPEEAAVFLPLLAPAWEQTPGALEWLGRFRRDRKAKSAKRARAKRPGKKRPGRRR